MDSGRGSQAESGKLSAYLKPINIWALSFGCILGWGAFVMPATTLLPIAGPIGSIIAMGAGALAMLVIAINLNHMAGLYPDPGGPFTYTKRLLGYDHAFLCSWSLVLAYLSIMWANATAVVLISKYLFGPVFQFGYLYQIGGYDVYVGEILVTCLVIALFALICCGRKRLVTDLNTALAMALLLGVFICFAVVMSKTGIQPERFTPAFVPDGRPPVEMLNIVALAPWAFLGFESVSLAAGECTFNPRKLLGLLTCAIAAGAAVYMMTTALTVMDIPAGYDSWTSYLADASQKTGIEGLPVFATVHAQMGALGVAVLAISVFSAIATSLLGLSRALSRLLYSMAEDGVLPSRMSHINRNDVPRNAIVLIMCLSAFVPFAGRAAIGWIVDVTSISAAIAYGYVSACALKDSLDKGLRTVTLSSLLGLALSALFFFFPLVPNLLSANALAPESYLILTIWSVLGLIFFRITFQRDRENRFGKSTIVWIALLFLVFFASTMWNRQLTHDITEETVSDVSAYYAQEYIDHDVVFDQDDVAAEEAFLENRIDDMRTLLMNNSVGQMLLLAFSLAIMFNIYSIMRRREKEINLQRLEAEQTSKAKTAFLSNMSHDLRTPMNAIIGYAHLAQRANVSETQIREYLSKIDTSGQYLLSLIDDVLEMSRIESGKMELAYGVVDMCESVKEACDLFMVQMDEKNIQFSFDTSSVSDRRALCDKPRFNRVLLNLLSNAYKFTPSGGSVHVDLAQEPSEREGFALYVLRVKDSGIGMSEEFAARVFESFERERSSTVSGIQGTGLGMAITKNIVDLMGGTIDIGTAPGKGTEFSIRIQLEIAPPDENDSTAITEPNAAFDLKGTRVLLVEDNLINREIATVILEEAGVEVDSAENGKQALAMVEASAERPYDAIVMDVRMPVMDGYDATRAIRRLENAELARIPIIAASANAFTEDVEAALDAGMNAHLSKPLDVSKLYQTLSSQIEQHERGRK